MDTFWTANTTYGYFYLRHKCWFTALEASVAGSRLTRSCIALFQPLFVFNRQEQFIIAADPAGGKQVQALRICIAAFTLRDASDQLVGVTYTNWASTPQPPANFSASYDPSGNRSDGGNSSGVGNRMQSDGTFTYQYDAEGNRTRRTRISNASADDYNTEYTWDNRNRLTQVTFKNNAGDVTKTVNYSYDMFNRLIAKDISVGRDVHERYVYDGDNLVLVLDGSVDSSGNALQENLFGVATDQIFASEKVSTAAVDWLMADNQRTVRDVARFGGTSTSVVDHLVYSAFGKIVSQSNAAEQPRFTYTAQRYDADAELYYDRARWYDARAGRFISEDPSGFAAGDVNLNRYVGNNPANGRDPSGLGGGFIGSPPGDPKIAVRRPDGPDQGDGPLGPFPGGNGRTNMWDGDDFVVLAAVVDPEDFPPLGGDGGERDDHIGFLFVGLLDTEGGGFTPMQGIAIPGKAGGVVGGGGAGAPGAGGGGVPGGRGAAAGGVGKQSWLQAYSAWFEANLPFGQWWDSNVGGAIYSAESSAFSNEAIASQSDGFILLQAAGVSIPAGFAVLFGGEAVIGVGTAGAWAGGGITGILDAEAADAAAAAEAAAANETRHLTFEVLEELEFRGSSLIPPWPPVP